MDFLAGIFVGYFLNVYALVALFLVSSLCVHWDNKFFATVFSGVLGFTAYKYFGLTLETVLFGVVGYLIVGFIWSFWRYKQFVKNAVADFNSEHDNRTGKTKVDSYQLTSFTDRISIKRNVDNIVFWVVLFPFSMFESLLGDFIDLLYTTVTVYFRKIYDSILASELKNLKVHSGNE